MTDSALAGPWEAVLCDIRGFVYPTIDEALEDDELDYDDFEIHIVRGNNRPVVYDDQDRRMPGIYHTKDTAHYQNDFQLVDDRSPAEGGAARLAQAQAMAAGLNAAWKAAGGC